MNLKFLKFFIALAIYFFFALPLIVFTIIFFFSTSSEPTVSYISPYFEYTNEITDNGVIISSYYQKITETTDYRELICPKNYIVLIKNNSFLCMEKKHDDD